MNLFNLAMIQLKKEGKPQTINNILEYAQSIRLFMDVYPCKSAHIENTKPISHQERYKARKRLNLFYKKQGIKL